MSATKTAAHTPTQGLPYYQVFRTVDTYGTRTVEPLSRQFASIEEAAKFLENFKVGFPTAAIWECKVH